MDGSIRFGADGLVPAVVQDAGTGQVLMLAWMNALAVQKTLESGETHFWSRSRQELWHKGATSGNTQQVVDMRLDCDGDSILLRVRPAGPACHTGETSCFFNPLSPGLAGEAEEDAKERPERPATAFSLQELYEVICERRDHPSAGSYTSSLFAKGEDEIVKKIGEEAIEVILAAKGQGDGRLVEETADLAYHLLVLLAGAAWPPAISWRSWRDAIRNDILPQRPEHRRTFMNIRPLQDTGEDYDRLIVLHKLLEPQLRLTPEGLRQEDREYAAENLMARFLGERDGHIIAGGAYWHSPKTEPGVYGFSILIHPDHQAGAAPALMHDTLLDQINTYHPQTITSLVREDAGYRIRLLERDGFRLVQRNPRSQLDVHAFEFAPYSGLFESLAVQGIGFRTLTQVMEEDPDWRQHVWLMFRQIEIDIPTPRPEQPTPYEEYAEYYEGEEFRPDSWAIAIDERLDGAQRYVGMSVVNLMTTHRDGLFAGITGTVRSHRRRKIATALKLRTIEYACQQGYRYIVTDNEENNPMYTLNLKLGFQPLPANLYYERAGTGSEGV